MACGGFRFLETGTRMMVMKSQVCVMTHVYPVLRFLTLFFEGGPASF